MPIDPQSGVYYEVHGDGIPLFLGFPVFATSGEILGQQAGVMRDRFIAALVDRYQVLLVDYPSIGRSAEISPDKLTADRVCTDLLSVASAAGMDQFIYWGYSWGAAVGYQLAARTNRLLGLVVGAWPPLGAQYQDILAGALEQVDDPPPEVQVVLRRPEQYAQWVTFYSSISDWPEHEVSANLRIPKLAFAGANGDVLGGSQMIRNASTLRERRSELEQLGWQVRLIEGHGHEVGLNPDVVVPVVRAFLDAEDFHAKPI